MAAAVERLGGAEWRAQLGQKLVAPEEAVSRVESGWWVGIALAESTPQVLCAALAARLMEIENVTVNHCAAMFNWDIPGLGERFRLESCYLSAWDRPIYARGGEEFTPVSYYRAGTLPPSLERIDAYLVTVSPPNRGGYVSFGHSQIMSKVMTQRAAVAIAEIDERAIWTGGDNAIHLSAFDHFVERPAPVPDLKLPDPPEEERRVAGAICEQVARELVPDRATIQVGVGSTSGAIMRHLGNHHDLGMQTEIVPIGAAPLVRDGVLTGKYKRIFPGLVVGAGFAIGMPREELDYVDGNPRFHLYDFNLTDDIRLIAREEGLIAINNALSIDLTGQVNAESIGPQMYTGTGGQTAFAIGAVIGGGTTVTVLPSTATVAGQRVSRIVPMLAPGSVVTLPRTFVHQVVTEYGIAILKGKSIRQRAGALIAIAHPDFRAELAAEAKRLWS